MIALVIEACYALVFVQSFIAYARRRDPVQRDLTLVFAPLTSLLVLEVARRLTGTVQFPAVVTYPALTLLLAQPYLTMRLVRMVRPVPAAVMWLALGVFVATTVPFYFLGQRKLLVVTLAAVVAFFAVQGYAAALLTGEAWRRTGAPRARLMLAAGATAVLGLCLLMAGVGGSRPGIQVTAQVLALLSGLSYMVAFMPPLWLRKVWAAGAAYRLHHHLVNASADESSRDTWRRYASIVRDVSGASAALVLLPGDTGPVCAAAVGDHVSTDGPGTTASDLRGLLDRPQPVVVGDADGSALLSYAARAGARTLIAVPLQLSTSDKGALVLLSGRYPMFVEDDARLLGELGGQAAILAQRGETAQAIRTLNTSLEQRVAARTAELARSNEELQRFAYVASHDLQEPLRKIVSFSSLLVERVPDALDPDSRMYLDRIVGSAARMQRLIEDLLMYSRVGATPQPQAVDCDLALASALDSLALALADAGASVTHDPLPTILANRTPVEQLFQNLIGNAVKYRSETPPRIHVSAEELADGWRVTVTDNGIGVDMAYADRIFHVFQRLHPRGRYEGTGIGLAVCKRIVESYGGRIGVDSIPGAGATFWFILPAASGEAVEETRDAVAHHAD
jgi:signal transduction histidine kinase